MRIRLLALVLIVSNVAAQTQSTTPIFRATTRLVEINVIVRDKNGPVGDLTLNDFQLFDKGKPQKIAAFSVVALRTPLQPKDAAGNPAPPLAANLYTNRPEMKAAVLSSTTVVLLDGVNTEIRDQSFAKEQFLKFLSGVKPTDRIAVYALGSKLRVLHEFTSDARRLVAAVAKYSGDAGGFVEASNPTLSNTEDFTLDSWLNESSGMIADHAIATRVQITAAALEGIAHHIGRLPGRKSIVWISGSFPFSIGHFSSDGVVNWDDAAMDQQIIMTAAGSSRTRGAGGAGGASSNSALYGATMPGGSPSRSQANFDREILRATRALNDANVAVYPVDARGLIVMPNPKDVTLQPSGAKWSGSLEFAVSLRAADGSDLGTSTQTIGLNLDKARYDAVMQEGMTISKTVEPKVGMAQIRILVFDRVSGRVGSLILPVK